MNTLDKVKIILLLLPLASLSCMKVFKPVPQEHGHFYLNPQIDLNNVGKVVLFELENHTDYPYASSEVSRAVIDELQKTHIFTLRALTPDDPEWESLNLGTVELDSIERLNEIKDSLRADAVITGALTRYYPYPHLTVAMSLRMTDLRSGKLIWAMEQVWDSTDKNVELRMKNAFKEGVRTGHEPLDWQLFTTSPRAFNRFVASEVAQTFPQPARRAATDGAALTRLRRKQR